jgi:hypothetical protein
MTKQVKFYTKDVAGNIIQLDTNKIYAEFSTGETLTIEVPNEHKINDLVLRSYYGNDELSSLKPGEKWISSRITIAPGATNVVGISVVTEEVTRCDDKPKS